MTQIHEDPEAGFTLVELIVAIIIVGIIVVPLSGAIILGYTRMAQTGQRSLEAGDSQLVAAYFVNDVQGSDQVLVSGFTCGATLADGSTAAPVVEFALKSDPTAASDYQSSYSTVTQDGALQLYRVVCKSGVVTDALISKSLASVPTVTCAGATCSSATPATVSMVVTEKGNFANATTDQFTVTGTRRQS